jgi:AcrR family transcriptional regulator
MTGLRPPQQRRSRESMERVLDAGERILAKNGYEGFTMPEVGREAKASMGLVYGRFENKDALVYAIHRRMLDRMREHTDGRIAIAAELDLDTAITQAVHRLADEFHRERRLLRPFMYRAAVDEKIAKAASKASQAAAAAFREIVVSRKDQIAHEDVELAADVAFRVVYDVLARRIMRDIRISATRRVGEAGR